MLRRILLTCKQTFRCVSCSYMDKRHSIASVYRPHGSRVSSTVRTSSLLPYINHSIMNHSMQSFSKISRPTTSFDNCTSCCEQGSPVSRRCGLHISPAHSILCTVTDCCYYVSRLIICFESSRLSVLSLAKRTPRPQHSSARQPSAVVSITLGANPTRYPRTTWQVGVNDIGKTIMGLGGTG